MKIGFLCGSFDPIHMGHIHMISLVLNNKIVDKVVVIPTLQNPWKKKKPLPLDIRIKMIKNDISIFGDKCEVTDIETKVEGTNYSYKTCQMIREMYKDDDLYIIAGTDVANSIKHWKKYEEEIEPYFGVIEINRSEPNPSDNGIKIDEKHIKINTFAVDVSSTYVRSLIQKNLFPFPYLSMKNALFINDNKYYINA